MIPFNDLLYLHKSIKYPYFSGVKTGYNDLIQLLNTLSPEVKQTLVGHSVEGRNIYRLDWGKGPCKVVIWSQMHGNEGTSTRALIDVILFLTSSAIPNHVLQYFAQHFHFIFLPMLNPDGAELWQRENALGIDINRDARRFTSPESQLLRDLLTNEHPQLCFNLHDQALHYSCGSSPTPATITLLAPPLNAHKESEDTPVIAMRLVEHMYDAMQSVLPQHTAKWNDDYEVRAFGEWSQKHIAPTLLIEAGGYANDPNREVARSLQFALIVYASHMLLHQEQTPKSQYDNIPLNRSEGMFDHIERGTTIHYKDYTVVTDKGYRENEIVIGDLTDYGSYSETTAEVLWF